MKAWVIGILLSSSAALVWAGAKETVIVRKGDTLSMIVLQNVGIPLYGPESNLQKVLQINPWLSNPNLIYPGQEIRIYPGASTDSKQAESPPMADLPPDSSAAPADLEESGGPRRFQLSTGAELSLLFQESHDETTGTSRGTAHIRTYPSPALLFEGKWNWSELFSMVLGSRLQYVPFAKFKTLSNTGANQFRPDFWAGTAWNQLRAEGGIRRATFERAPSANLISFDGVWVPYVGLSYRFSPFSSLWFEPRAEYLFSSSHPSYSVRDGFRLGAKAGIQCGDADCYLGYRFTKQDTSILSLTEQEALIGVTWAFFR